MRKLPGPAWAYVGATLTLAGWLIAVSLTTATAEFSTRDWTTLAVLAVLFWVCDSAPARLGVVQSARVSLAFAASLASVVLFGPAGAALLGLSALVTGQRLLAPIKRLFNGAQFAISGYAAGAVFELLGGSPLQPGQADWVEQVIVPFVAAAVTFVGVNLLLMAGILLLSKQAAPRELVRESRQL
ncbi:MAG: metal-dependent phosphohydrolase, partial [Actinomadura rubrobrunea]|nr:metal-dependent phosphohydrolase [Actinomadura rubrobrunea]